VFVGVGASRVRDLFDKAKAAAPAIVFIDEIDAIGRQRGGGGPLGGGTNDEREQTLNQLLTALDGFEPNQAVIVLAATKRESLDRSQITAVINTRRPAGREPYPVPSGPLTPYPDAPEPVASRR